MSFNGWFQILVFFALVVAVTRPLGAFMFRIFEGERRPRAVERLLFRLSGVDEKSEQTWLEYAMAMLAFSAVSWSSPTRFCVCNSGCHSEPAKSSVPSSRALAFNTAAESFTYLPTGSRTRARSTMSYLAQMAWLACDNSPRRRSASASPCGRARPGTRRAGSCWGPAEGRGRRPCKWPEDDWQLLGRPRSAPSSTCSCLLSFLFMLVPVSQGVIQNFSAYREITTLVCQAGFWRWGRTLRRRRSRAAGHQRRRLLQR